MKTIRLIVLGLIIAASMFMSNCNTSGINVEGSWIGTILVNIDTYDFAVEFTQSGSDVGGTAEITFGGETLAEYTVDAILTDNDLSGQFIGIDIEIDTYDIDFDATVDGSTIEGTFIIEESSSSGTFTITKS